MTENTYSVSQVARIIGKSPNTIRSWSDDKYYGKQLSIHDRSADDERRYTDADVALLQTVKVLRDQHEPHKRIIPRIAADERLEPPAEAKESPETPAAPKTEDADTALMTEREARLIRDFGRLEGEFGVIKQERDRLRDQLDQAQQQVKESTQSNLEAETRAVAAEVMLDMAYYRRRWFQFWRPQRPQDADYE
jgi:DNA-binding transcriptional MerR regulator